MNATVGDQVLNKPLRGLKRVKSTETYDTGVGVVLSGVIRINEGKCASGKHFGFTHLPSGDL